jgi:hypothetical protein
MNASTKFTKSLLRGVAWLLFAVAGLALWMGGRSISEFTKTARTLAEMEGIGLAVLFAGLGAVAKAAADHFGGGEKDGSPTSDGSHSQEKQDHH